MYMILLLHANALIFGRPQGNDLTFFFRMGAESMTIIAVNVFVLITGYFGTSFRISRIANLCFQILFAVFPITLLLMAFKVVELHSIKDFARGFKFWHYWFINAYIGLVLLSPILNAAVKHLSRYQFKTILVTLFIFFSFVHDSFFITPPGLHLIGGYSTMWFLFLYLLGRYVAVYSVDKSLSWNQVIFIYLIGLLGTFLCMCLLHLSTYNSPFITIQALGFLLIFSKFSFSNKAVNFVASSSLMVFLLHVHPLLKEYYMGSIEYFNDVFGNTPQFVVMTLGFCVVVFMIAVLYDQLRKYTWSFLEPLVKKLDSKVASF